MIEIYNVIQEFISSMIIIDFSTLTSKLPNEMIVFYNTYIPTFINYFIVGLVIFYFSKLLIKLFSLGGTKWVYFGVNC